MSQLAELQRAFLASVLRGEAAPALRAAPLAPARGLAIYREHAEAIVHAALAAGFPVVHRLVGDAFFAEMVRRYGAAHPARCGDLARRGAALPAFIEAYAPAASLPYLGDVARLELAREESLAAADAPALDVASLATVAPERLGDVRLALHPSVRQLELAHAVVEIWRANQPGCDGACTPPAGPQAVLVWRDSAEVRLRALDAVEHAFLAVLAGGAALAAAVERLGDEAGAFLAPALARHARDGIFTAWTLEESRG